MSHQQVVDLLGPYDGPSEKGVDTSTLDKKVWAGYQGWFTAPGDGSARGWYHWQGHSRRFLDGECSIDLWPDVSELDDDEKFATPFKHADGSTAYVYSSQVKKTVVRHFKWMKDAGIDGVFVNRFATEVGARTSGLHQFNNVLINCRAGANQNGRGYALMYDLSGLRSHTIDWVINDWKILVDNMKLTKDPADKAYMRHNGKPVVGLWGVGFNDRRRYSLDDCLRLVKFFKDDPKYGGCAVMLGVPTTWRTFGKDSLDDPKLHEIIIKADVVSPWMVGRIGSIDKVEDFARDIWAEDVKWCREKNKDYMPVVYPGFSWYNLHNGNSELDVIPRLGGKFLWKQYVEMKKAGVTMVYQAMFDEVDEATAIFKCTNNPPVGKSKFLDYEDLPTDHYLWLTGQAGKLLRDEIKPVMPLPKRKK